MKGKVWTVFSVDRDTKSKKILRQFLFSEGYNRRDVQHYAAKICEESEKLNKDVYITDQWIERYAVENN